MLPVVPDCQNQHTARARAFLPDLAIRQEQTAVYRQGIFEKTRLELLACKRQGEKPRWMTFSRR
jgi:hypothetical protein